ncbi:MAG: hypothetical protein EOM50_09035 [Erysipelotrichia bacterium]|nr:hypothetical protein [Erysipelotrichia bacterium]
MTILLLKGLICMMEKSLVEQRFYNIDENLKRIRYSIEEIAVKIGRNPSDIKLMAVCGCMLGWQNTLLATFIAILLAGSYATYLIASKKVSKRTHIAFGPYLCIGIFIATLYGTQMITMYLSLFNL